MLQVNGSSTLNGGSYSPTRQTRPASPSAPDLDSIPYGSLRAEQVSWLWPGRIPLGGITILEGDPGLGKSQLTIAVAARVSRGLELHDGTRGLPEPAAVLLLSAEDHPTRTVLPRLLAAGADPWRVHALPTVRSGATRHRPVLPDDLEAIEREIRARSARLVILDPLVAYLSPRVDSYRDQDVRGVLAQIDELAVRTDTAILAVRHLTKTAGARAIYRGGGSIGLTADARSVLVFARDKDDPRLRVLAITKSNLAEEEVPALIWRIVSTSVRGDDPDIVIPRVPRVELVGEVDLTADQLLAAAPGPSDRSSGSKRDAVQARLREILADGERPAAEVIERLQAELGVSERTIDRAKAALEVESAQRPGPDGQQRWLWRLPEGASRPNDRPAPAVEEGAGLAPLNSRAPERQSASGLLAPWHPGALAPWGDGLGPPATPGMEASAPAPQVTLDPGQDGQGDGRDQPDGQADEPSPPADTTDQTDAQQAAAIVQDRAHELLAWAQELMRRPLSTAERADVLAWAQLARDGALVPLDEIREVVRQIMTQPARDGMPPASLHYANLTVQGLARGAPRARESGRSAPPTIAESDELRDVLRDPTQAEIEARKRWMPIIRQQLAELARRHSLAEPGQGPS